MTHPADAYMRARDVACASVGTPRECMGAPRASGRRDRASERSEGCACTSGVRAWAWWMRVCVGIQQARTWAGVGIRWARTRACVGIQRARACGDPAGTGVRKSSRHGRAGIQRAQTGVHGDPAGTGVRGSSGHGRACVGIHRARASSRHGRAMIQRAWTRACEDPASMNDSVVIPRASKRSV